MQSNKLILGIDLDDTLIRNQGIPLSNYNDTSQHKWHIIPSAKKYLGLIQSEFDAEFHLITARSSNYDREADARSKYTPEGQQQVQVIVQKIEQVTGTKFKSVTFTSGKRKGQFANNIGCDYIIDDNIKFIEDCHLNANQVDGQPTKQVIPLLFGTKKQRAAPFPCVAC
jgi:hypothetical protein